MKASSFALLITPIVTIAIGAPGGATPGQGRLHIKMPAQDLRSALRALARRSGHQLVADSAAIRGKISNSLDGDYSIEEAVAALIGGLDLSFEVRHRTIIVRRAPRPPTV